MSSRRASLSPIGTVLIAPEVFNNFDETFTAQKLHPIYSIAIGLICGSGESNEPVQFQCAVKIPNPTSSAEKSNTKKGRQSIGGNLDNLDDEWVRSFAYQLHRMLCGASRILGIYAIGSSELLTRNLASFETLIRTLMLDRTTTAAASESFYLVTLPTSTSQIAITKYTFSDKKSPFKSEPVQFKLLKSKADDLIPVETTWALDLLIPVKRPISGESEHRFYKLIVKVIGDEVAKIESAIAVHSTSNQIIEESAQTQSATLESQSIPQKLSEILEMLKKPTSQMSARTKKTKVPQAAHSESSPTTPQTYQLFSKHPSAFGTAGFESHQVASGCLRIRGVITGRALVLPADLHVSATRALKLDLIKSLQSRVGLMFDEIASKNSKVVTEEEADATSLGRAKFFQLQLPRRVVLRSPIQQCAFCDYITEHDSNKDLVITRFASMLGVPEDTLNPVFAETDSSTSPWSNEELDLSEPETETIEEQKVPQAIGKQPKTPVVAPLYLMALIVSLIAFLVAYIHLIS